MTATTRPDAVLAPADSDVPSPARPTPETTAKKIADKTAEKTAAKTAEKTAEKKHWVIPVVVGVVAFGAGVAVGCDLTWRFSIWWKPS